MSQEVFRSLLSWYRETCCLDQIGGLLGWDQETYLPPRGAAGRAEQIATLALLSHRRWLEPALAEQLQACHEARDQLDPEQQIALTELRREHARATRLPADLVKELAAVTSQAQIAWREAREKASFDAFAPHLEAVLGLLRQKADALGHDGVPYDALLDLYERGATSAFLAPLFAELRQHLGALFAEVHQHRDAVDGSLVRGNFDLAAQTTLSQEVVALIGFDLEAGRVDEAAHPFSTGLGPGDVRLTRRFLRDDLRAGLFATLHEAGHGLYEQGLPERWIGHPLRQAASTGVHESQSRLWENVVGRSQAFWVHLTPRVQQLFPTLRDATPEQMFRAVNEVQASLIRVEADELTYNLHVLLRFELERELFAGNLAVRDLPAAWNDTMAELLGIRPPDDADGCLQDIHWSLGYVGYFPTYTLGNLYASQLFEQARTDLGDLDQDFARGEFGRLLDWLRREVHDVGCREQPPELIRRVTGQDPTPEPFLRYLRAKFGALYGLTR